MKTRDYMITYNLEKDSISNFKENILPQLNNCQYIIGGEENGEENGYLHCHIFIHFKNPISFDSLQKKFKIHHIETRKGSIKDCINYCIKTESKVDTNNLIIENTIQDSLFQDKENVYDMIIEDILCGSTFYQILIKYPKIALYNYSNLKNIYNDLQEEVAKKQVMYNAIEFFGDKLVKEEEKNE